MQTPWFRSTAFKVVALMAAVLVLWGLFAGGSSGAKESAILGVLRADKAAALQHKDSPGAGTTPQQCAAAIVRYCEAMENYDMSGCPADFVVAYREHVRAWRSMQSAISNLPNGFLEGFVAGALNSLLMGELDGGTGRMQAGVDQALNDIKRTWRVVEKIGAKHGAAL